jgi:hypothetical protein
MNENKFVIKCVTIKREQQEFLEKERVFKLSKFVQAKLDEYIKMREEYKQFMEKEVIK